MKKTVKDGKKKLIRIGEAAIITIVAIAIAIAGYINSESTYQADPEIVRTMEYDRVIDGEEMVSGTDNVQFDAFFLRDLNGDGYAEGVRGTCKQIGKEDTLYMELNVLDGGHLKDAKVKINSDNFYFQTAIVKDDEIANNYISNNTKEIQFNEIQNGTQKLLMGIVRSGDYSKASSKGAAIGNDINKYSKQNSVILTGTHVADDGTEIQISKTVPFMIDWYGITKTEVYANLEGEKLTEEVKMDDLATLVTAKGLELEFNVEPVEVADELILKKSYLELNMPRINGYLPTKMEVSDYNIVKRYNKETGKFIIEKQSEVDNKGIVTKVATDSTKMEMRYNQYAIKAIYPLEAYGGTQTNFIELKVPVKAYYEGYNNSNVGASNPYKSNEAQTTIVKTWKKVTGHVVDFNVGIGKHVSSPIRGYVMSKEKPYRIYNGISTKETNDRYEVFWNARTNYDIGSIIMKETRDGNSMTSDKFITSDNTEISMNDFTTNVGVYFEHQDRLLGENGWIKIYNDETNQLIETFTKGNWNNYTVTTPYYYSQSIKHIRVETSTAKSGEELMVYNIKELDDEYITKNYTVEQFKNIQHVKTNLSGSIKDKVLGNQLMASYVQFARYITPVSIATISVEKGAISTQETGTEKITITTKAGTYEEQSWEDGKFLVKLPSNIILAEVVNVAINNDKVKITGYDVYEKDGNYYIKILTDNTLGQIYDITLECRLTPDPRGITQTNPIELYASNKIGISYKESGADIYDVNDNFNIKENVNYTTTNMSFIAPNSLITSQTGSNFDNKGSIVIAPQIGIIEKEQRTANISINMSNNYTSTISDISILGKIPFKGNTTAITGRDLGSTFTTTMAEGGVKVPSEIEKIVTVYYSEKEKPTKDVKNSENGWKKENEITDWSKVKTYLIDFKDYIMEKGETHSFAYQIKIPEGLAYNEIAYSSHAVYFCLDTENGKYRTQTEPSKLGFIVAKRYRLEITKYQEDTDKLLSGITYMVTEEGKEDSKIKVTNNNGKLEVTGLYSEKVYVIKEIKTLEDYELKEEEVRFTTTIDENDALHVQILSGTVKQSNATLEENGWTIKLTLENKVKARLKINKETQDGNALRNVKFSLNGKGKQNEILTTDISGEIYLQGIHLDEPYTLSEVKAKGYYLIDEVNFKIIKADTGFEVQILSGEESLKNKEVTVENEIPTINFQIANEKIPTYNLEILKIKKDDETQKLEGAQFKLEGEGIEKAQYYLTDANGSITIPELYQYVEGKKLEAKYTLTEVLAPEGYATDSTPIVFKAQVIDGKLQLQKESGNIKTSSVEGNTIKLTIENSSIFNLTKYTKVGAEKVYLPNAKFKIYALDDQRNETIARDIKGNLIGAEKDITFTVEKDYPWIEEDGVWQSGNKGQKSTTSTITSDEFVVTQKDTISFDWTVSSEGNVDYLYYTIKNTKTNATIGGTSTKISGTTYGTEYDKLKWNTVTKELEAGTYTLSFSYKKDSSIDKGLDTGYVRNIKFGENMYIQSAVTTDEKGSLSLNLPQGLYKVVEEEAPEGYQLPEKEEDRTYYFGVGTSLPAIMEMKETSSGIIGGTGTEYIESVVERKTGGYYAGGYFESKTIALGDGTSLTNKGNYDGFVVKYDNNKQVEWAKGIGGTNMDQVLSVAEVNDGGCIAVGTFYSSSISLENGSQLVHNGNHAGFIIKYNATGTIQWVKNIGGNASGSWENVDEVVATDDGGFIVVGSFHNSLDLGNGVRVTSNGFNDGMIIKYNSNGVAQWAKAIGGNYTDDINTISLTNDGGFIVGGYFRSDSVSLGNGVRLSHVGERDTIDGMVIKYNSNGVAQWAREIGGTATETITSVIETNDSGVAVGGYFNKGNISLNGTTLTNKGSDDGFVIKYSSSGNIQWAQAIGGSYIDRVNSVEKAVDGDFVIAGHVGSRVTLDNSVELENGGFVIEYDSSEAVQWIEKIGNSQLVSIRKTSDTKYIIGGSSYSNKSGQYSWDGKITQYEKVVRDPEVPEAQAIEIENILKQYNITTEISPNTSGERIGGTITGTYNSTYPSEEEIRYVETVSHGKDASENIIIMPSTGYRIKQITLNGENVNFTVDATGKVTLPALKNITEDKHYVVTFDNTIGQILVHHYIDGTTTKVADDQTSAGTIGEKYTTQPKLDLVQYELKKLENGDFQIPDNWEGTYQSNIQEIIYYYTKKQIPLTVHHYIEGTMQQVPLANGETAKDQISEGQENETYTTSAIPQEDLSSKYELVEIPNNYTGSYAYDEIVVTYYYKLKTVEITTKVETHTETNAIGEPIQVAGGTITGQGETPYETVIYSEDSTKEIIAVPDEGYQVNKITVNGEEIQFTPNEDKTVVLNKFVNMTENKEVIVTFKRIPAKVIVHHYIQGTTNKVPSKITGEVVQDEEFDGIVGDIYATQKSSNAAHNYICLEEVPEKASGNMTEETIEVIYYYVLNAGKVENAIEKTATERITASKQPVTYNIHYHTTIADYVGKANITIVDTLPYKIDNEKSQLDGGIYNEESQTITWTENLEHINTYQEGTKVIDISKQIIITYQDLNASSDNMENHVKGVIAFEELGQEEETETTAETLIDIKGKVIVKYVDAKTNEEIKYTEDETEKTYGYEFEEKVGTDYATNKKEIEGYDFVRSTQNIIGKVIEGTTEVIYYYNQRELKIITGVKKHEEIDETGMTVEVEGGTITGKDEDPYETVIYGKNSVKDIIAVPEEGYRVSKITINGIEIPFTENEDKTVTIDKFINMKEDKVVIVSFQKIEATVIVHHYIVGTKTQVPSKAGGRVADEQISGYVGKNYTTHKSAQATANYTCVEEKPEKASGNMTEETIEVIYYYELKEETVETTVTKTATADKTIEQEVNGIIQMLPVLTQEDGKVVYTIEQHVKITDYIGKAKIKIVDTLPAKIDLTKSNLADGVYDESKNTITWEIIINNIDTYANGIFDETITKNIEIVYKEQDVTKALVNKAVATVTTYYPESHIPNPGEEKETITNETEEKVEQEYKVEKAVEKIWDDNNNAKGNRPQEIKIQLTANGAIKWEGTDLEQVVLSQQNQWTYVFGNLPKYDDKGNIIDYGVQEIEMNENDLEYYEKAQITKTQNKIIVTNSYKLVDTKMDSKIEKTATEKITASKEPVTYNIKYHATITDYIGEAILTITDELPYKIDSMNSNLSEGNYNEETNTITWQINLGHMNTFETGNKQIDIEKQIVVIYQNLDASKDSIENKVKGKIELTQTDKKNEVEDTAKTNIDIVGTVVVKYIDIDTNEEITYVKDGKQETYQYEFTNKVGTNYETEKKNIKTYNFVKDSGNTIGKVSEGLTEVIYYYKRIPKGTIIVKYVDEDGNEIASKEEKTDYVGEAYETEQKEIENYDFVEVTGEPKGEITEGTTQIIYHYKKVPTDLVVKYLEKGTNQPLLEEEHQKGFMGDVYETTRKEVENYRAAAPEPENAKGKLARETTYVTYYYEKIPSGKITVKYVDIDTNEEIIEKIENKPYGYEISGYVGEKYQTEEKNIPYYEYIKEKEPTNKEGIYQIEDDTIIYYYRKLPFNFSIDKTIKEITVDGEKLGNKKGKDILKVEVVGSKIEKTEVIVRYRIQVKNTGKIDGTAEILEKIPKGYEVDTKETKNWKKTEDGNLITTVTMKAGEERELEVVLKWKKGNNHLGEMKNTVEITKTTNLAEYEEITLEDNKSEAEVLMSVKTGSVRNIFKATLIATIIVGMIAILEANILENLKNKEKNNI